MSTPTAQDYVTRLNVESERSTTQGPVLGVAQDVIETLREREEQVESLKKGAIDVLTQDRCKSHTEKVKRQTFQEFVKDEERTGCRMCLEAERDRLRRALKEVRQEHEEQIRGMARRAKEVLDFHVSREDDLRERVQRLESALLSAPDTVSPEEGEAYEEWLENEWKPWVSKAVRILHEKDLEREPFEH